VRTGLLPGLEIAHVRDLVGDDLDVADDADLCRVEGRSPGLLGEEDGGAEDQNGGEAEERHESAPVSGIPLEV
jgi:hypothetical protein